MTDISNWFKIMYTGSMRGPGIFPRTWQGVVFFIIYLAIIILLGVPGVLPLGIGLKVILIIILGIIFLIIHVKVIRNPRAYDD